MDEREAGLNARLRLFLLLAVLIMPGIASAQNSTNRPAKWAQKIEVPGVKNCFQVSSNLYRGAQPTAEGMTHLKELGVRSVINLRYLRSDGRELHGTGLKSLTFPMVPWHANAEEVVAFLKATTNTNNLPVFVHCERGADRTGLMCAMYRIVICDWTKADAIAEMKNGGFNFSPVWQELVEFIERADIPDFKRRTGLLEKPTPLAAEKTQLANDSTRLTRWQIFVPRGTRICPRNPPKIGTLKQTKKQMEDDVSAILHLQIFALVLGRLLDFVALFPRALGRLGDEALLEGAGGHANVAHFAIGHQRLHALDVHTELALGDRGHVRADTAGLLGFTRAPNDAALHRAFAGQFTNA
jgi:protein tyrosine phosphatase (PTP) superfamily phosphohydrolase (DUF442 family)